MSCDVAIHTKMDIIQTLNWTNSTDDWLVAGGKDRHAIVFSSRTGKQAIKLDGHSQTIQSAVFSADDKHVFTLSVDRYLIIHKLNFKESRSCQVSKIETRHCVDMALKASTLVSVNKTQAYCYSFKPLQGK